MGGVPTKDVVCSDYADAATIDAEVENYILNGLIPEVEEMITYGWAWWALYIWNLNTQNYTDKITMIIECGISGNIEDSVYGNSDWMENTWAPGMVVMQEIYDILNIFWFPVIVWSASYTGIGFIAYTIASVIMMLEW